MKKRFLLIGASILVAVTALAVVFSTNQPRLPLKAMRGGVLVEESESYDLVLTTGDTPQLKSLIQTYELRTSRNVFRDIIAECEASPQWDAEKMTGVSAGLIVRSSDENSSNPLFYVEHKKEGAWTVMRRTTVPESRLTHFFRDFRRALGI